MKKKSTRYSIAEARNNLPRIIHQAENGTLIELTRRGESVAVLLSKQQYQQFREGESGYWNSLQEFRKKYNLKDLGIDATNWDRLREKGPGRAVDI